LGPPPNVSYRQKAAFVLMARDEVRLAPSSALAYYPVVPRMKEPPAAPFGGRRVVMGILPAIAFEVTKAP